MVKKTLEPLAYFFSFIVGKGYSNYGDLIVLLSSIHLGAEVRINPTKMKDKKKGRKLNLLMCTCIHKNAFSNVTCR